MQSATPVKQIIKIDGITEFLLPLILFGVSFYLLPWYLTILLYLLILFSIKKEYVITAYVAFTFYNIMLTKDAPFWTSLISSFGGLAITFFRIGILKRRFTPLLFIPISLILGFVFSFLFFSMTEYYYLTGLKSLLQLVFLLAVIIIFTLIPERHLIASKKTFDKMMPSYIISYALLAIILYDFNDRFGAGSGPQCLALQMAFLLCYLCDEKQSNRFFQFILLVIIFFTGSRTYFILAGMILAYDYFRNSPLKIKIIVLVNAFIIASLILFLLPLTNSRFDYTSSTFWGTLFGRLKFYQYGFDLFWEHPITGNGMGSMLKILEEWVYHGGLKHYRERGDTTIVHNEYLRILIETGLVGLSFVLYGVACVWKKMKEIQGRYIILLFLLGSMVENTLTLYTTGALLFLILLFFINTQNKPAYKINQGFAP